MIPFVQKIIKQKPSRIISAGILICISIVFIAFRQTNGPSYTPYTVTRGDITETVTISGNANSSANAAVYSPSTGIVASIFVSNGDTVTKGQEILRITSTATEVDQSNAYAAYQSALSAKKLAEQTKLTNQSLLEQGRASVIDASVARTQMIDRRNIGGVNPATGNPYTQDEIDRIESSYISAKQSFSSLEEKYKNSDQAILSAQSTAQAAWLSYQATVDGIVKAPIDGTITNLSVATGDAVLAKTPTNTVPSLFRITTGTDVGITVRLNEIDISRIHTGQSASVVFDAIPQATFSAIVSRVDTVGETVNAVVTYASYITLLSTDERIRPSMTATVTINTDPKTNIIIVPNTALKRQGNTTTVLVSTKRGPKATTVSTGVKNSSYTQISEGLNENETILIPKE